jgi:teichuronic acid biosynthesis glycosyltransferase TuaH
MKLMCDGTGQWDGLIVLCAVNSYHGTRMADWHVAQCLSRLAPVLFVDPPMSPVGLLRRNIPIPRALLRLEQPSLARLTPVVEPFPTRRAASLLTAGLARAYLRRAVTRLGGQTRAVISSWPQHAVFGACSEQVKVYWARDDFVGGASLLGLDPDLVAEQERHIAAAADVVVAATPVVASTWRERGLRPVLVPYGTDVAAYRDVERAPLPLDVNLPGPIAGFVGRLNQRTDLRLLEMIAARGRSLLLVGPHDPDFAGHRFDALRLRRNVHWVGPKPYDALPGYLRLIDVGLVPYQDSAFNRGSFPLKTLEYLAAGRAVVATDLPAARWLGTNLVSVTTSPEAFVDQVDRLLAQPRTDAMVASRQAFAARHSWALRAAQIYETIAERSADPPLRTCPPPDSLLAAELLPARRPEVEKL